MEFKDKLKEKRLAAKMSQAELASRAGVGVRTIQNYESGARTRISTDIVLKIANALGVSINDLMDNAEIYVADAYEKGGAIADMTASVAVIWNKDLLAEIEKDNKFSVFFAAAGDGNVGKDGDIAAFSFKIPDDAEVGTVYETGFFYRDGDAFANADASVGLVLGSMVTLIISFCFYWKRYFYFGWKTFTER